MYSLTRMFQFLLVFFLFSFSVFSNDLYIQQSRIFLNENECYYENRIYKNYILSLIEECNCEIMRVEDVINKDDWPVKRAIAYIDKSIYEYDALGKRWIELESKSKVPQYKIKNLSAEEYLRKFSYSGKIPETGNLEFDFLSYTFKIKIHEGMLVESKKYLNGLLIEYIKNKITDGKKINTVKNNIADFLIKRIAYSNPKEIFPHMLYGFRYKISKNMMFVIGIPNKPSNYPLTLNDQILKINGIPITGKTKEDIDLMLNKTSSIDIEISRNNKSENVKLKKQNIDCFIENNKLIMKSIVIPMLSD